MKKLFRVHKIFQGNGIDVRNICRFLMFNIFHQAISSQCMQSLLMKNPYFPTKQSEVSLGGSTKRNNIGF